MLYFFYFCKYLFRKIKNEYFVFFSMKNIFIFLFIWWNYNIVIQFFSVSITVQDLQLHNLSTFIINKAKLSLIGPTIAANITVPRIYVEGFYNISGDLSEKFQLHGYGPFKGNIHDFQLFINTILGYSRGVYLKTFDLDFTLRFIDINLKNLMDDQELNDIMNKVVEFYFFKFNNKYIVFQI